MGVVVILFPITISIFIVIKITKTKKQRIVLFIVLFLVLAFIASSASISILNLFIDFDSPESAFNFSHSGEIIDTVYGDDSCMIIYLEGKNKSGQYYVSKSEKGYKLPTGFITKRVSSFFTKNGSFNVYKVSGTSDYYIIGMVIVREIPETIVDSNNKEVKHIVSVTEGSEYKTVILYGFINKPIDNYYLRLDDEIIYIE